MQQQQSGGGFLAGYRQRESDRMKAQEHDKQMQVHAKDMMTRSLEHLQLQKKLDEYDNQARIRKLTQLRDEATLEWELENIDEQLHQELEEGRLENEKRQLQAAEIMQGMQLAEDEEERDRQLHQYEISENAFKHDQRTRSFVIDNIDPDMTREDYKLFKKQLRNLTGKEPSDYGLPARLTSNGREQVKRVLNQAIVDQDMHREIHRERVAAEIEDEYRQPSDELVRLQEERDRLQETILNEDMSSREYEDYVLRIGEITDRIQKATAITGRTPEDIAPSLQDEIYTSFQDAQLMNTQLEHVVDLVEDEPLRAGVPGMLGKLTQDTLAPVNELMGTRLEQFFPKGSAKRMKEFAAQAEADAAMATFSGRLDTNDYEAFFDPGLSDIEQLERALAYRLARIRKPSGRLNVDDLKHARAEINMQGWTSASDVKRRLGNIMDENHARQQHLVDRMRGGASPDEMQTDLNRQTINWRFRGTQLGKVRDTSQMFEDRDPETGDPIYVNEKTGRVYSGKDGSLLGTLED